MSIIGKSTKSSRRADVMTQSNPAVGFKVLRFAHKATAGDTGFSINGLTTPSEMTALGFSQPQPAELQAINLQLYKKNLILASSARGLMQESLDFVVAANGQINFSTSFGTALADEIFVGTVDPVVRTGSLVADTTFILETGTLAANTTDIPVGRSFLTNTNSSYQQGAVQVTVGGQILFRNTGNATATPSADGDYQEVDSGNGYCNLIRLNNSDPSSRSYIISSTQLSTVNPNGSLSEDLQRQQATIDQIVTTLSLLAGVPTTNFQAAPTQPLLRQFADRVVTLEQNRARIDQSNTWTAPQDLPGATDGASVPTGYIGEVLTFNTGGLGAGSLTTGTVNFTITASLPAGIWFATGNMIVRNLTSGDSINFDWSGEGGSFDTVMRINVGGSNAIVPLRPRTFVGSTSQSVVVQGTNSTASRGDVFYSISFLRIG